ncbi:MAG: 2-hydroxy-3-oxopropionate reductase [Galactobacter sp.]
MSTKVTVIGLGIMGLPMAKNLLKAGFDVTGYNRSQPKIDDLIQAGGKGAGSIAESVTEADVIITMVPDSPDVEAVLTGEDAIIGNAKQGAIWIDASTIRPDVAQQLAATAKEAGLRPLDAPVSGGEQGAIDAALSIMVGGDPADLEAAKPVLDAVGKTVVHVGASGAGQTVKAANQLIVAGNIAVLAEGLLFLEAHDADLPAAIKVLGGGLAGSKVLDQKAEKMRTREFAPGFRLALHNKDLGIITSAAREAQLPLPVSTLVAQLVTSTLASGDEGLDHSGIFRALARIAGADPDNSAA